LFYQNLEGDYENTREYKIIKKVFMLKTSKIDKYDNVKEMLFYDRNKSELEMWEEICHHMMSK
jgi:hypothetical protein